MESPNEIFRHGDSIIPPLVRDRYLCYSKGYNINVGR